MKQKMTILALTILFVLPTAIQADDLVFNEEWVWKYAVQGSFDTTKEDGAFVFTRYEFDMRFDGTSEIDGIIWHNFKTTKAYAIEYTFEGDNDQYVELNINPIDGGETFLVRVEDNRYFMRFPEEDNTWRQIDSSGVQVYDFTCNVGDSFEAIGNDGRTWDAKVKSVSQIEIDGKTRKVMYIDPWGLDNINIRWPIIEGIGYIENGVLPFGNFAIHNNNGFPGHPSEFPNRHESQNLTAIEDLDGNVIFSPSMLEGVGVDDIEASGSLTLRQEGNLVSAASDSDAAVTIEVVGIDSAKRMAVAGRGAATADLSTLATGVYVVRATDGHDVKTLKVMAND